MFCSIYFPVFSLFVPFYFLVIFLSMWLDLPATNLFILQIWWLTYCNFFCCFCFVVLHQMYFPIRKFVSIFFPFVSIPFRNDVPFLSPSFLSLSYVSYLVFFVPPYFSIYFILIFTFLFFPFAFLIYFLLPSSIHLQGV